MGVGGVQVWGMDIWESEGAGWNSGDMEVGDRANLDVGRSTTHSPFLCVFWDLGIPALPPSSSPPRRHEPLSLPFII